jgi:genome maintenance exonuclease 1
MTKFNHVPVELPELKTITIDRKRFYVTPKENYYPSITTVLSARNKEGLMEWRKRVGDEVANYVSGKAAARGTKVHHMCEDYLNNMESDWPDKWEEHKKNFLPWCLFGELKDKVLGNISDIYAQECSLYSDKYRVAGRVDCIAKYNGVLSIIDFKTSTKERSDNWNENYYIQCSAGIDTSQIVILVVTEDGVVQEFIKNKSNYLDMLTDSVIEWENQNETDSKGHPIIYR